VKKFIELKIEKGNTIVHINLRSQNLFDRSIRFIVDY